MDAVLCAIPPHAAARSRQADLFGLHGNPILVTDGTIQTERATLHALLIGASSRRGIEGDHSQSKSLRIVAFNDEEVPQRTI
jgi:hypothetical protein